MKIRDHYDETRTMECKSGIHILSDDGSTLYYLFEMNGTLEITTGGPVKHNGVLLGSNLRVRPKVVNIVCINRDESK
jgi:hypothetical protein